MHTATTPITPDNLTIEHYIRWLFEYADREDGIIALRGLTEKGTGEGQPFFMESAFADMGDTAACMRHALRWCEHGRGSFIVPAIVAHQAAVEKKAGESMMLAFTTILIDVDDGDTQAKLAHAIAHIGKPSMLVRSGGMTDAGKPKYHAYWRLSEPCWEVERVSAVRTMLAQKIGADGSFGRSTQVIRIPGTIHNKNNNPRLVEVDGFTRIDYHFDELAEAIEDMPPMPGIAPPATSNVLPFPTITRLPDGTMNFAAAAGLAMPAEHESKVDRVLTEVVHEGGVDGETRFDHASIAIGHEIRMVREGRQSREQALQNCLAWNLAKVSPPWPEGRVIANFNRLWDIDIQSNGAMPLTVSQIQQQVAELTGKADATIETVEDLLSYRVDQRSTRGTPPAEKVLVQGFFMNKKRHLFVGDGAAGKTFLMMDLALRLAAASEERPLTWLGQPIGADAYGGTVILLLAEDNADDLDRRWHALDPDFELRDAAGGRLIALPMSELGGMPQVAAKDPRTQEVTPSTRWIKLLSLMKQIVESGGWISAVVLDTLNSTLHGEENSAAVINEFISAVSPVCGSIEAALIVTHHIGKTKADAPVRDLDDMKRAVRGSSALPNAMRVVVGIWAAHNWEKQMKLMGLPPQRGRLLNMGVIKANSPGFEGVKTLYRADDGVIHDVSHRVAASASNSLELQAWMIFTVREYARLHDMYFQITSKIHSMFAQKEFLPPALQGLSRADLEELAEGLVEAGALVKVSIKNHGTGNVWLDTPERLSVERVKREMQHAVPHLNWADTWYDSSQKVVRWYGQNGG